MPPVLVALVPHAIQRVREQRSEASQSEARAIRTPNLLIWSQTRYHCAIAPLWVEWKFAITDSSSERKDVDK